MSKKLKSYRLSEAARARLDHLGELYGTKTAALEVAIAFLYDKDREDLIAQLSQDITQGWGPGRPSLAKKNGKTRRK